MADRTRIRIRHPYPIDLVRAGARKPERRMAAAPIDIDVRTATAVELVVASSFRTSSSYDTWRGNRAGEPAIELHGFDGALWTPLSGPEGTAATLGQWQDAMAGGPTLPDPQGGSDPILATHYGSPSGHVSGWDGVVRLEETRGRVVAEDRRHAMEAAIRAADDVLLVDGRVWRRTESPFWSVERSGSDYTVCVRWCRTAKDRFNLVGLEAVGTFAADRLDEAMSHARALAAARRNAMVRGPGGACLIHDPVHARRDDRVINALELGRPVVQKLGGLVREMSNAGVEAYVEARTLLGRLAAGDGDAETVLHLSAAFAKAMEDLSRFDFPLTALVPRDELRRDALGAFDARMARFDAIPEAALPHPAL